LVKHIKSQNLNMKKLFSTKWIGSTQPRKQRKYRVNAPLHTKHKFLSASLSKELKKKYGKRNLPLRKGDEVLVMRGSFKKKRAKVVSVNLKNSHIELENINRSKKDGTKIAVKFSPSVLQIQVLDIEDIRRLGQVAEPKNPEKSSLNTSAEKKEKSETKSAVEKNASEKTTNNN